MKFKLKIGRHEYEITEYDKFLDNGACVQLMTQTKIFDKMSRPIWPILSQSAVKQINGYLKSYHKHGFSTGEVFSLTTL